MASRAKRRWPPEPLVIEGFVPDDFYVNAVGTLRIDEGGKLYHIHGKTPIVIAGNLNLRGTQVRELPEGLSVGGSLDLEGTQIRELPEGLSVGGDLNLAYTQIRELPEGLRVGGYLDLHGTPIRELPKGLSVGG